MSKLRKLSKLSLALPLFLAGSLLANGVEDAPIVPVASDASTSGGATQRSAVTHLDDTTFDDHIRQGVVFVEFFSNRTTVQNSPLLDDLAKEFGDRVSFCRVNLSENKTMVTRYNLRNVPAYIIFKNGVARTISIGPRPVDSFRQAIADLKPVFVPRSNVFSLSARTVKTFSASGVVMIEFYTNRTDRGTALLEDVARKVEGVARIGRINCSEFKDVAREFEIKNVPTYVVFKDGIPLQTIVGSRFDGLLAETINTVAK
ncbi:MAG: hypothetical protein LBG65_07545 [Puniceicoccales bacterium]|jgi:thioredoxin-like negative regulator of GroEL|nr:hypothetical protein [Puniceicoccales bacterium]